jgi:vacuolar-type H+-ATPase subunit I/STV1
LLNIGEYTGKNLRYPLEFKHGSNTKDYSQGPYLMFNKDFDPLQILQDLQGQVSQCSKNITQLAQNIQQMRDLNSRVVDQLNQQTHAINALDQNQQDHDGRIRLIEITKQYENQNPNTHN